jgi:hypothetical protein
MCCVSQLTFTDQHSQRVVEHSSNHSSGLWPSDVLCFTSQHSQRVVEHSSNNLQACGHQMCCTSHLNIYKGWLNIQVIIIHFIYIAPIQICPKLIKITNKSNIKYRVMVDCKLEMAPLSLSQDFKLKNYNNEI